MTKAQTTESPLGSLAGRIPDVMLPDGGGPPIYGEWIEADGGGMHFIEQRLEDIFRPIRTVVERENMVRAKFKVTSIEENANGNRSVIGDDGKQKYVPCKLTTLKMHPVYSNGDPKHENSKFWAASPGGELTLNCVNPAAVEQFKLGQEFYLDFTPAGEPPAL